MRIAIVVAFFDPSIDYFETTAARVLSRDHEVHIVTSDRRSPTLEDAGMKDLDALPSGLTISEGISIHRLKPWFSLGQRVIAAGVDTTLKSIQPDVVLQVVPAQLFSISATRFALAQRIPIIYISGENSQQGPQKGMKLLLKRLYLKSFWRIIIRRTARRASKVFATTEETRELLRKSGVTTTSLLPLPYRSDKFCWSQKLRNSTRHDLGVEGKFVTAFVGRFVSEKQIESIVEAWDRTAFADPDAHLILVGSTEDDYSKRVSAAVYSSLNSNRITVVGFSDALMVNNYLNAADVGIWPTVSVGIQQAMATGLLVLLPSGSVGEYLIRDEARVLGATYVIGDGRSRAEGLAMAIEASRAKAGVDLRMTRAKLARELYSDIVLGDRLLNGIP